MKLLYIGSVPEKITCGGDQLNRRNIDLLSEIFGAENITFCSLDDAPDASAGTRRVMRRMGSLLRSILLYAGGLTPAKEKKIRRALSSTSFDFIFITDSMLGRIIPGIKRRQPKAKVITIFHNVMSNYAWEFVKTSGPSHLPFFLAVLYNEKLTARRADICITLNARESELLKKTYGRAADIEMPISYKDRFDSVNVKKAEGKTVLLFVGINFFANVQGIRWFIDEVMPFVSAHLVIAGSGMDALAGELTRNNVEVHGYVPDLDALYYDADLFVLPIFTGGGMKTKTAEGLMFGKSILGTREAFTGYDLDFSRAGALCENAAQFIEAINHYVSQRGGLKYNEYSRIRFLADYSHLGALERMKKLFIRREDAQ